MSIPSSKMSARKPINIRGPGNSSNPSLGSSLSVSSTSRVKMKIKPFKKPPAPPADLYDRTFSLLLSATRAILHKEPLVVNPNSESLPSSATSLSRNRPGSPTSVAPTGGIPISREELYRSVEDLCVHGYSTRLYNDVCQVLETGALHCLLKLTDEKSNTCAPGAISLSGQVVFHQTFTPSNHSLRILNCAREIYSDFLEYLTFVRSIFLYLDRTFVLGKTKVNSLWDAGMDTFRRHTMYNHDGDKNTYSTVIQTVIASCLHQIKCEREGEAVDRVLLRSIIRMLADLPGCFHNQFIPRFIAESVVFFESEGNKWMETNSSGTASEFLAHIERRWNQANDMSVYYLDCSAAKINNDEPYKAALDKFALKGKEMTVLLATVVEQQLLLPHVESFLLQDKHLYPMLDDDSKLIPDLRRLYILLRKVNKLNELRVAFGRYGKITGMKIIQGTSVAGSNANSKETDKEIIPNLLKWKERLENIHRIGFMNDDSFGYSSTSHAATSTAPNSYNYASHPGSSSSSASSTSCLRLVLEDVLNGSSLENNKNYNTEDYGKRVAELLSKHVDLCLRSAKALAMPSALTMPLSNEASTTYGADSLMKANDSDPEHLLDKIMSIFRYLQSKDTFEAFFKRDLAKRLLLNKSASIDLERSFISKLKTECGTGYTSKMEGMFKDMELSREVMSHYSNERAMMQSKQDRSESEQHDVDMEVQILTTGYWPVYQQFKDIKLPPPLLNPLTTFETYYKNKYQGRRVVWQHSLGNCIVKAHFPHGAKDLVLSQYQALVLVWCFNEWEEIGEDDLGKGWTISEIMEKTGIEDRGECERVLQSLSVGRDGTRVLIKRDPNLKSPKVAGKKRIKPPKERKTVLATDTFHYNHNFTSRQVRIKITSIQMKETAQERDDTHQSVSRDRLYLIDAAVVRIMKARKTISHQALVGEVMNQLRFPATGADIKKRIGGLMDREYMERTSENRDHYNYLA